MLRFLPLLALLATGSFALAADAVIPARAADEFLKITGVRYEDGTVSGHVVNDGTAVLRNIRLRILCSWRWADETNPGTDDPSWAAEEFIDELEPGAEVRFRHEGPPRPDRDDGRFHVEVTVAGLDRVRVVPEAE